MALSITSNYAGEAAGKYISAALLSASTLEKGLITVMPNVKYKANLQIASYGDIVRDATCDYTTHETLTITEKVIEPLEYQVNTTLCKAELIDSWEAQQMGFSAFTEAPKSFSDFVIAFTAAKVASEIESTIWNGAVATNGQFDGFYPLATAGGSGCVSVAGAPVTATNVVTELGKIVDAVPQAVYGKEDLVIYVAPNIARAYVRALGGFVATIGGAGVDNKGPSWYSNGALSFDGIPVVVAQGMPASSAMAAQKSNMFFGTGLLSDTNSVQLIDTSETLGDRNLRVVMRFTAAVAMGINSDVVIYA